MTKPPRKKLAKAGTNEVAPVVRAAGPPAQVGELEQVTATKPRYFRTFYLAYPPRKPEIRHIQGGELLAVRLPEEHAMTAALSPVIASRLDKAAVDNGRAS